MQSQYETARRPLIAVVAGVALTLAAVACSEPADSTPVATPPTDDGDRTEQVSPTRNLADSDSATRYTDSYYRTHLDCLGVILPHRRQRLRPTAW